MQVSIKSNNCRKYFKNHLEIKTLKLSIKSLLDLKPNLTLNMLILNQK